MHLNVLGMHTEDVFCKTSEPPLHSVWVPGLWLITRAQPVNPDTDHITEADGNTTVYCVMFDFPIEGADGTVDLLSWKMKEKIEGRKETVRRGVASGTRVEVRTEEH